MSIRPAPYLPWFLAAAAVHAGLIFAWTKVIDPRPHYAVAPGESIEMTLIESAPAPPAEPITEPAPLPEPEVAPPPPEPLPEPMPQPIPPVMVEPLPAPVPKPATKALPARRAAPPVQPANSPKGAAATAGPRGVRTNAKPNYLSNPPPAYPLASKAAQEEGVVLLSVEVNAQGRPASVRVRRSSGFSRLDEAALRAVRGWRFSPARVGGIAISSEVEVPVRFQLD